MKTIKIWVVETIDENDIEYCRGAKIQIEMVPAAYQDIHTHAGTYQFQGSLPMIKLFTFDEKTESMLQLKFAGRATLLQYYYAHNDY